MGGSRQLGCRGSASAARRSPLAPDGPPVAAPGSARRRGRRWRVRVEVGGRGTGRCAGVPGGSLSGAELPGRVPVSAERVPPDLVHVHRGGADLAGYPHLHDHQQQRVSRGRAAAHSADGGGAASHAEPADPGRGAVGHRRSQPARGGHGGGAVPGAAGGVGGVAGVVGGQCGRGTRRGSAGHGEHALLDSMTIVSGKIMPPASGRDPGDPPVFILVASPAWAPWLPDTAFQKVPIGSTGQVLTVNADGSIGWSNSSAGFTNPMSATGDLIISNPGSAPVALHIGSSGQVLLVAGGLPAWAAPPWVTNPLTTQGDLIVQGVSAAARLGIGTNNQVLTSNGTTPGWANSAAGFADPTTTAGDLIFKNAVPTTTRLGVGTETQVLTVSGGLPAWANSAAGFANPMTSKGDLIFASGMTGAAARLGIGASNQVLTVSGGVPVWASGTAGPAAVVFPSGDTTGVTDQGNTIAGNPVCLRGLGASTIIFPVGAGTIGIYYHRTTSYGAQFGNPADPSAGFIRDLVLDGTFSSGAAQGLNTGDGRGYQVDVTCQNFNTTGAIGFVMSNDLFWCEKSWYRLQLYNNTQAALLTTGVPGSDHSNEYNIYDINMFCELNQQGVVVDGTNQGGSELHLRGNMQLTSAVSGAPTNNIAALTLRNTIGSPESRWYEGQIWMKVEGNSGVGGGSVQPYTLYSDGNGYIRQCSGAIHASSLTPAQWNNAEFTFRGLIADSSLSQLDTGAAGSGVNGLSCTYQALNATTVNGSANFTCTGGGLFAVGSAVTLVGTIPGGFAANTLYYAVSSAGSVMTFSATTGGAPITATSTVTTGLTLNPAAPPVPASGTIQQNYGPDAMVYLTGGTGVTVVLQGNPVAGAAGPFYIPAAGALTVNYTTAPTWIWAPCAQSQY